MCQDWLKEKGRVDLRTRDCREAPAHATPEGTGSETGGRRLPCGHTASSDSDLLTPNDTVLFSTKYPVSIIVAAALS